MDLAGRLGLKASREAEVAAMHDTWQDGLLADTTLVSLNMS